MMFDVYVYPPNERHFIEDQTRGMILPSNLGCSPARVTMPIPNHRRKSELHSRTAPPLDEVTGLIEQTITNQLDGWNCPEIAISQWGATPWFEHGSTLVQPYRWIDLDDSRNHDCHDSSGACTVCVANPWMYERYCKSVWQHQPPTHHFNICGDKPINPFEIEDWFPVAPLWYPQNRKAINHTQGNIVCLYSHESHDIWIHLEQTWLISSSSCIRLYYII